MRRAALAFVLLGVGIAGAVSAPGTNVAEAGRLAAVLNVVDVYCGGLFVTDPITAQGHALKLSVASSRRFGQAAYHRALDAGTAQAAEGVAALGALAWCARQRTVLERAGYRDVMREALP